MRTDLPYLFGRLNRIMRSFGTLPPDGRAFKRQVKAWNEVSKVLTPHYVKVSYEAEHVHGVAA